ncbi:MAG: hypothetical protein ABJG68_08980 [Crocinitomicaceae bacterium]
MKPFLYLKIASIGLVAVVLFACNKSSKWTASAAASSITYNSLAVNANYDITGAKGDVEVGLCWNDTGNPNPDHESVTEIISTSTSINYEVENLYANHVYYIRPFLYQDNGTALIYGDELAVTTGDIPAFDNCTLTTGEVDKGGTIYSMGNLSSVLNSTSFEMSVTTSDFDFTFHFKEEPHSGIYLHDTSPQYLQDFQWHMTVQVFDGDNCTYYGTSDQPLHVKNENDVITLSFCELEVTTSGTCTSTLLLSGELSGN